MKHLLSGVAVAAALIIAAPVWAQNPSGGNAVGTPGPNPGGPGLTPYSGGGAPAPAANSAMPPAHRHAHAMHHFHHHMARRAALTGDTTAQLNREELGRIQSGNLGNPAAPPAPMSGPQGGQEYSPTGRYTTPSGQSVGPKASGGNYIPPNQQP
ncbi:MAG: hypothetical protein WA184_01975 [Stellaceae bacterium]